MMLAGGALWPAALVFDLDGTLADSFAGIDLALNRALAECGLPARDLAWTRAHVGRGAAELVRDAVAPADEEVMREVGAAFARHYEMIYREHTPPLPGAAEVLALAAARTDGRVAIVSNKHARFSRGWLEHWGLARHVAIVTGPDTAGARKPEAGALLPVLAALGVAAADALLVGDMEVDAAAGRNAGVAVVLVHGGATPSAPLEALGAVAVLGSVAGLPAWLAAHGRGWS
jgi:phosphoglycolate phosphatase